MTLHAYFLETSWATPGATFISTASGFESTYADAVAIISALCVEMDDAGLQPGDKMALYCDDTIPLALLYLASAFSQIIPVPISPQFSLNYFVDTARRVEASCVFAMPRFQEPLKDRGLRPILTGIARSCFEAPTDVAPLKPCIEHDIALEALQKRANDMSPDQLFMLQPTSGSSGLPKLVKRTHTAFARYAVAVGSSISQLTNARTFLSVNALTHAFGLHMFTTAISMGGELKVTTELDTKASLKEVRAMDPAILPMVPRILQSFLNQHKNQTVSETKQRVFGHNARILLSAGAKSNPGSMRRVQREGVAPIEFYGSSEASIVALSATNNWTADHVGKIVKDVDVQIADDGEILVRSPGVTSGYFDENDTTEKAFTKNGFYKTGDIGALSTDGLLRIEGRKRDVFNTPEGSNIYPERIELMLEALPWVHAAMLVGDERPCMVAFLVLASPPMKVPGGNGYLDSQQFEDEYTKARQAIRDVNKGLESMECIRDVALFCSTFSPQTYRSVGSGKVRRDRKEFLKRYEDIISRTYDNLQP